MSQTQPDQDALIAAALAASHVPQTVEERALGASLLGVPDPREEEVQALKAHRRRMVEALQRYGWHTRGCDMRNTCCTCGFRQALDDALLPWANDA